MVHLDLPATNTCWVESNPVTCLESSVIWGTSVTALSSRSRRAPKQSQGPNAESCGGNSDENEPRFSRQIRPFLDDAPDMSQSEQTKEGAGGYDIGLHGVTNT